jgi:CheY-like chemotaxis protein
MRVLVADQNAVLLAAISATFGQHCDLVTATRREACLAHAERQKFDVVVAADKLADYTGLELLSEVAGLYPGTLLIFAASPTRLKRLGARLEPFGLLETITYPLTPRKLLEALKLARRVLRPRSARKVRHVVLESEWDTGERLGLVERELEAGGHDGWQAQTAGDDAADPTEHVPPDVEHSPATQPETFAHGGDDADDFVSAAAPPPPVSPSPTRPKALMKLPAAAGPAVRVVSARLSRAVVVSNDPIFDQPPVPEEPPIEASVPAEPAEPAEPEWAEDGAANDTSFEPKLRAPAQRTTKRPKARTPSQPTAAQLAAFERALARRNAERAYAGERSRPAPSNGRAGKKKMLSPQALSAKASSLADDVGSMFTGSRGAGREGSAQGIAADLRGITAAGTNKSPGSSKSLSELARMAGTKRPLVDQKVNHAPKRAAFVVGSGLAVVLLAGLLTVELLRTPAKAERISQAPVVQAPFAQSSTDTAAAAPFQAFAPAAPQVASSSTATAANFAQPQNIESPAPPDPPPPPALEHPGPMEPPSEAAMHSGPPLGMVPPGFEPEPDGTDE